jgi:hypothetical protein
MAEPLKVVVWGAAEQGPCSYFRGGELFVDELREKHNVEVRMLSRVEFKAPKEYEGREGDAIRDGVVELDTSPIEWGDVVVFRRYYNTAFKCGLYTSPEKPGCGYTSREEVEAAEHEHGFKRQDDITRLLWPLFRDSWTGGVVYETDDDHWRIKPWNGYYVDVINERDLIREMTQRADIVTVATPALIENYGRFNKNIRVVRNAIDPDLYVKDVPRPDDPNVRLVYYGSTARLRDYAGRFVTGSRKADGGGYAFQAVEENKRFLTRVFLGTNEKTEHVVRAFFDEETPYISNIAAFSKALANSWGDIGVAPLGGDEFDRCKSELHWLEYAITDMAFVGERFSGNNSPYSVVRDGVDGLLVRGRQEWYDAIKRLATSPQLRADLAGAAKERVLAEYDYRVRAAEWADVFRYAAENARGALPDAA